MRSVLRHIAALLLSSAVLSAQAADDKMLFVEYRVVSADLDRIRRDMAEALHGLLSSQDSGGWRPHVTIQNKVPPKESRAVIDRLAADFRPCALAISGLGLHRYLGGPWETLAIHPFRGR